MPTRKQNVAERILDKALELGESGSWDAVRLHSLAEALDLSLDEVRACYAQKDDLVEAWFDRADAAVLEQKASETFLALTPRERLRQVILAWLDALAPHRRLTREMLAYKLEPGHLHLQALGVMRISRTVQWFLEAAQVDVTGLERTLHESALSALYLATFARWLYDDSPQAERTRSFLDDRLRQWEALGGGLERLFGRRRRMERLAQRQPLTRVGSNP
jgi:ubiquinone biosynthesis protein COQ9